MRLKDIKWPVLGISLLVIIGVLVSELHNYHREPVVRGKSLSEWLDQYDDLHSEKITEAHDAVLLIGTNALPSLIRRLECKTGNFYAIKERILLAFKLQSKPSDADAKRRGQAVEGFRILNERAQQATPQLAQLLTNRQAQCDLDTCIAVGQSLAAVGSNAIPVFLAGLNHPNIYVRRASVIGLSDLGQKAETTVPSILQVVNDKDAEVRGMALRFISKVCKDKHLRNEILRKALQDSDPEVSRAAGKLLKDD